MSTEGDSSSSSSSGWWKGVKSFFGYRENKKMVFLGLDAAGKTTFLYKVKAPHQEVVATIPTIGFNVETIVLKSIQFTCWDIGGCDKIRPLWRHFTNGISCCLVMIDSNDRDRDESFMQEVFLFFKEEHFKDVPILFFANKQDLPNARNVLEIIEAMKIDEIKDRCWGIIPTSMYPSSDIRYPYLSAKECLDVLQIFIERKYNALTQLGIYCVHGNIVDKYSDALRTSPGYQTSQKMLQANPVAMDPNLVTDQVASTTEDKATVNNIVEENAKVQEEVMLHERTKRDLIWDDWISRDLTNDDTDFINSLLDYSLESWDHYTHVRIAWILIRQHGVEKGFQITEDGIKNYIANSSRTNGKSFHPTMTRFWCHMIAFWIKHMADDIHAQESQEKKQETANVKHDFIKFLNYVRQHRDFEKTDLANGALFKVYYTGPRMFSEEAKAGVISPDIIPLPEL